MTGLRDICSILRDMGCTKSQVFLTDGGKALSLRPDPGSGTFVATAVLGLGGCGCVLKCLDAQSELQVAFKVPFKVPNAVEQLRFIREFTTITNVRHPSIVQTIQSGIFKNTSVPWFTMEFVDGKSLASQRPVQANSKAGVLRILEAAQKWFLALVSLHETDCFHRDLKPGNILWTKDFDWKIVDFGLSILRDAPHVTNTKEDWPPPGTRAYMPSEQWEFGANDKSDQFSMAATVYEWLAGRRPYPDPEGILPRPELLPGADFRPVPVHVHNPHVPESVSQLLAQMLQQDQDRRFRCMRDASCRLAELINREFRSNQPSGERRDKELIAFGLTRGLERQIIRFRRELGTVLTDVFVDGGNPAVDEHSIRNSLVTCKRIRESLAAVVVAAEDDEMLGGLVPVNRARSACANAIRSIDELTSSLKHFSRIEFACKIAQNMIGGGSSEVSVINLLSTVEPPLRRVTQSANQLHLSLEQVLDIATGKQSLLDIISMSSENRQILLDPIIGLRDSLAIVQLELAELDEHVIMLDGIKRYRLSMS